MILWELELKYNLATQVLMIKLDVLKMLTALKPCLAFGAFIFPCYICLSTTCVHPCYFHTPDFRKVALKIDGVTKEFPEDG